MSDEKKPLKRTSCVYRVFAPLCIQASGQWINASPDKPVIADLSDVGDKMLRLLLERKQIETADGTPINQPTGERTAKSPCPCRK